MLAPNTASIESAPAATLLHQGHLSLASASKKLQW
jgi:pantothenate synthetase